MDTKAELYRRLFEKYGDNLDPQLFDSSDIERQKMGIASEMRKDQSSNAMAQSLAGALRGFGSVRGKMPETNIKNYLTSENPEYATEMGGLDRKQKVRDYLMGKYFDIKKAAIKGKDQNWDKVGVSPEGEAVLMEKGSGLTKKGPKLKPDTGKESTGDKTRQDSINMGLNALNDIEKAYAEMGGIGGKIKDAMTIGDTPYSFAMARWEEAIGRMQSGGVIGAEEGIKFRNLAPTRRDSAEIAKQKIIEMRRELGSRLNTLGKSAPQVSQKIRVTNGEEILEIDPSDVEDAKADGYEVMK